MKLEPLRKGHSERVWGEFLDKLSLNSLTTQTLFKVFFLWFLFGFDFVVTRKKLICIH